MNGGGRSDSHIVPRKPANNGGPTPTASSAGWVEGRGLAKGNLRQPSGPQTQSQEGLQSAFDRIREAAERNKVKRFTVLWPHVYDPARLAMSYFALKKEAVPGVDGQI